MITNAETARQVRDAMLEVNRKLEESLKAVEESCSSEEYARYKKAVGKVVARLVFDILEPLYEKNPMLKPPNWDQ